jgi:hypothetical protein
MLLGPTLVLSREDFEFPSQQDSFTSFLALISLLKMQRIPSEPWSRSAKVGDDKTVQPEKSRTIAGQKDLRSK